MNELQWMAAGKASALEAAGRTLLRVRGVEIAVFRLGDALYALEDGCPHGGASLCTGRIDAGHVRCPAHGLRFRLSDGRIAGSPTEGPPSAMAVRVLPVRIVGDVIELQLGG